MSTTRGSVRMDRNGTGKGGEAKLSIPKSAFETYKVSDDYSIDYIPMLVELPNGESVEARVGMRRNVFVPDLPANVSGLTARLVVEEVHESDASGSSGSAAAGADPLSAMAQAGDVDGLTAFYEGVDGIGPKKARALAERRIAAVQ